VVVTNLLGSITSGTWTVRMLLPGMVGVWGDDSLGACNCPASMTNAAAIAAGGQHCLAAGDNGTVLAWGANNAGQCNVPNGLSNVVAVAAGTNHSLALKSNGTVVAWGTNNYGQTTIPAGLSNVVAIAAAANQCLALRSNGTVVAWGQTSGSPPASLTNATAIAAGETFCLALTTSGSVVAWGTNSAGQCNVPSLTNPVAIAAGGSHALALQANGTVVAWGANGSGQLDVPAGVSNFIAVAAGTAHSLARRNDGTTLAWGANTFGQCNVQVTNALMKLIAASANHSMVAAFSPLVQYPINVTQDLLLVYNAATTDGSNVFAYYLANRPMVAGANVLALTNCPATYTTTRTNFTTAIQSPLSTWLSANPTKRPQYMVLFVDVPVRINANTNAFHYTITTNNPEDDSVSYQIYSNSVGIPPFITHINMRDPENTVNPTAAPCTNYINKLRYFGTNYSPGQLLISAKAAGYTGTNYIVDGVLWGLTYGSDGSTDTNSLEYVVTNLALCGVSLSSIVYSNGLDQLTNGTLYSGPHITNAANVAGYVCWGAHSALRNLYPLPPAMDTDGSLLVTWHGASGWWLIDTFESFNGQPDGGQGDYWMWFSQNAFGSTNYENTPVGAITNTDEPGGGTPPYPYYFNLWLAGKDFAICAWNARLTPHFQAVGDPFVTR
jgi:hypothetical protein